MGKRKEERTPGNQGLVDVEDRFPEHYSASHSIEIYSDQRIGEFDAEEAELAKVLTGRKSP